MHLDTRFSGRLIQVTEALSYEDAVSNQVLALDQMLGDMGLQAEVYTKWHDPRHETRRRPIEELQVSERDIVIYHCYGYAEYCPEIVRDLYCTRIVLYHNITPHKFFSKESRLFEFCLRGREQLRELLPSFHYFWADSQYNLDELIALGAPHERSSVIPIIVEPKQPGRGDHLHNGQWTFVGRIAPNKNQIKLVELFADTRRRHPELAQRLHLIGGFEENDAYYLRLHAMVADPALRGSVVLHGKIGDDERDRLLLQSDVFVSMSEHEGFGVPLIEAGLLGVPVTALTSSAVPETLASGQGLAANTHELQQRIIRVLTDKQFRTDLRREQVRNAKRFSADAVAGNLNSALKDVIPSGRQFQTVSVVICTYNRRDYLERVLDYLRSQSSSAFEVVVIDGPSDDGTKELLEQHVGHIKVGKNPERNLSKSRNLGIELASGDVIAFIDDDALPFDNWIENILDEYNSRPLITAGLGGPVYYAGTFWFQAEDNGINKFGEAKVNIAGSEIGKNGWLRYNTGTNATFSATALRASGGFDQQFDYYLDESEVCFRLQNDGWLIGYASNVVVRHEFAQSHNRQGRLNYNWHTICKNTAYFISAYSGLAGEKLTAYIDKRMETDRIAPIEVALAAGKIEPSERDKHVQAVREGTAQGISDARAFPRRRLLDQAKKKFLPFDISRSLPTFAEGRKRLHICIVSKEFPPFVPGGGIGTLYYHLASELLLMGHQVSVIAPGTDEHVFRQGDISVHFTRQRDAAVEAADPSIARNIGWSLAALAKAAQIHESNPIHVIDSALWDFEALALALLPKNKRPPVVVRLVTPFAVASRINEWNAPGEFSELFIAAETALMKNADALVPISESIAQSIEQEYDLRRTARWHKIPCGVSYWPFFDVNQGYCDFPELDRLPRAALESGHLVLFVGRLELRKGIDLVFKAATSFLREKPDAHLVVAGRDVEGWGTKLPKILPSALRERVHLIGEVPDATRDKLMARAYCLLFPSRYESFGLVPLEGFVHGLPVIASDGGAIPEVVEDHVSGLLFSSGKAEELASAVSRILTDKSLRKRLSVGALARVRKLSSRNSATATVALYSRLISASK